MIETGDGIPLNGKETDRGQVWRSDDGGDNWRVVSYDRNAWDGRTTTRTSSSRRTMRTKPIT